MKTYIVRQTFERIGDPCESRHTRKRDAERAAEVLRDDLAKMVAEWETAYTRISSPTGFIREIEAWRAAENAINTEYDEDGSRTATSPGKYGLEAGRLIAAAAVTIETEEA